ncbi:MAG: hypothetical protein A3J46_00320 [Candidatus Yanofskybacteria bacterium RIFCSPHIGHO2_02_FULL_41_11]|uniref:DHHA1 domain-containing protein n=1 Tax=Candidatus Yanofskybacteria bacterium RIFCSPHIGHO2_02_FULL_41_11 TaxID=1802675 RepID=A0A1F8F9F3_9BACT|nr:MAG: hypothetical protein A3J46_00320 [Candidatus Yanofskybacteria bacterium RIFCSPHIGHO2_02_FULL_41_11]
MIRLFEKRETFHQPTKDIVVLYHADCTDGFSAAWAAWKKFEDNADYIGINPGTQPLEGLKDKEIYMVDLVYQPQYIDGLIKENKKFVAIDHHFSNKDTFKLIPSDSLFDLNHSGAVLAWKYFHPEIKIPRFLEHVEDMDLWKFDLPKTKEIISYLDMVDLSFDEWSRVSEGVENESKFNEYITIGSLILNYQDKLIERIISNHAELVNFLGHEVYAVNSPVFNSQIANVLCEKLDRPLGIVWTAERDGTIHVSLRSIKNAGTDVSELAKKFKGGGGHKSSAGFSLPPGSKLPWTHVANGK